MADERIRISWDDVQGAEIDDLLQQQRAWARSAEHTPAIAPPSRESNSPRDEASRGQRLISQASVYLGLFGLVGALVAWGGGELVFAAFTDPVTGYVEVLGQAQHIIDQVQRGELSEAEGRQLVEQLAHTHRENPYLQILQDPQITEAARQTLLEERIAATALPRFLQQFLFLVLVGSALGLSLSLAEPVMAQNGRAAVVNGSVGLAAGLVGSVFVGCIIDSVYQALGGGVAQHQGQQLLARTVTWGILGAFLSVGPGIVLRNAKRLGIGIAGGLIGGVLGGALFDPLHQLTGYVGVSRFVGLLAIGGLTGAATGLLEQAVKTGWLQVTQGLIAGKQFVLYRPVTTIGSSPECDIYLFKDPQIAPQHATVELIPGGFELADRHSATSTFVNGQAIQRTRLRAGDHIQIGGTCFTFQERATAPHSST